MHIILPFWNPLRMTFLEANFMDNIQRLIFYALLEHSNLHEYQK